MAQGEARPGATTEDGEKKPGARYVMRDQIASLITTYQEGWTQTPDRSNKSRKLLNGDFPAPIPTNFKLANADQFRVDTPHKYLVPYHQRNLLAKDPPRVKRWSMGDSVAAQSEATKAENILQAAMDDRYPWKTSVDILLIDSVAIAIVLPETASMSRTPNLYEDGQDDLPDSKKKIRSRYERNAAGKTREEAGDGPYRASGKASAKVLAAEKRDILSRKIPVQIEILGPSAFIPVFAPDYTLDACVVQRYWTHTELLKKRLFWDGMTGQMAPAGGATDRADQSAVAQSGGRIKVTELYAVDYVPGDDGVLCPHPYVAHMVEDNNGKLVKAQKMGKDGLVDAITDLYDEYGLERLPVTLAWGQSWATANPDHRGMPFPLPFAQSWLAIDAILTGATVWAWWRGFPTLISQPNGNSPPDLGVHDDSPNNDDDVIEPLSIIKAEGTITELGTQGISQTVFEIVQFLAGANEEQGPPDAASGGGGTSGFQASLARAYADDAMADVRDGAISLYKASASLVFEILTGIAKRWGPVPIQRITKVPLGARSKDGRSKREILDLSEDLAGGLFDIDADFPPQPNLAKGQQWAGWVKEGLVLLEEFRQEIIGDPNPEVFIARRLKQKIMDSPEFQQKIMALVAQLSGNEEERQQILALSQGQAQQGTDGQVRPASNAFGVPPPALSPALPGGPMIAGPTPVGAGPLPNPAQMSLAGTVGGQIGAATQAAAAGGAVPDNLPGV